MNTFDHPTQVLKLPGLTASTPMGVVTSGWHMRRAHAEFSRHFEKVVPYPVAPVERLQDWGSYTPSAGALGDSVTMLQEMLAMAWYRLRANVRS